MTADTPRPERVTLSDEEMRVLHDHFLRYSIEPGEWARLIAPAVERIVAARESALRAQIKADERWDTAVDWLLNSRYSYDAVTPFYAFYDGVITEEELRAESVSHAEIEARRAARIAGGDA